MYRYSTHGALDPPHTIYEKNQKSPQRNKFKLPFLEKVIARCWPPASGTNSLQVLTGLYLYMNCRFACMFTEIRSTVYKSLELMTVIEDNFYLHLLPFVALRVFLQNYP